MDGSGKIWGCMYPKTGTGWRPLKCDANGVLQVDTSPGTKTVTEVLDEATIALGTTTGLGDCLNVDLSGGANSLALTLELTFNGAATLGAIMHVRASTNGADYDTEDLFTIAPDFTAGATIRKTVLVDPDMYGLKVLVENLDPAQTITNVVVIATVGA